MLASADFPKWLEEQRDCEGDSLNRQVSRAIVNKLTSRSDCRTKLVALRFNCLDTLRRESGGLH